MIPGWSVTEHQRGDREAWMQLRQADLCASEAGALFDLHKYTTRRRIFLAKQFGESAEQNANMRRGKIMEPAVAEAIVVDCGWEPQRCSTYLRARADDPLVRLGASLDYRLWIDVDHLLSHPKTRASAEAAGWGERHGEMRLTVETKALDAGVHEREWADGPPAYTVVQAAQQMMLDDSDGALVACLLETRAKDLHLYAIPRHREFEAQLVERVRDFWAGFEAGEEPAVTALDNEFMSDYYPKSDESTVDLSNEADQWQALVAERSSLKMQQKQLKQRIDQIEVLLKDRMREANRAVLPGWSITWKTNCNGVRSFSAERRAEKPQTRTRR